MGIAAFLWLCVWGGMFTDIIYLKSPKFYTDIFVFIQGGRALLPILALFVCLILLMAVRAHLSLQKTSIGYLIIYCLIGIMATLLLSPRKDVGFYWGGLFLSALMVDWLAENFDEPLVQLERLININLFASLAVLVMTLPQTLNVARGQAPYSQFFELPFGLGQMRVNGVGRFALIVAIFAFVRFVYSRQILRYFWGFCLFLSLLTLFYTRSRTSLLGLAVVSLLYVFIQGINLRYIFVGPVVAYILWVSGYKWRAQQSFEKLIDLTGREYTWERGLEQVGRSPLFGWGFHADRLMLDSEHMHNSYLHAAMQAGIVGGLLFAAAFVSVWVLIIKNKLLQRIKNVAEREKKPLLASVLILGFLTSRGFFESTAAFYGVDLLVLLPSISYIFVWVHSHPLEEEAVEKPRRKW